MHEAWLRRSLPYRTYHFHRKIGREEGSQAMHSPIVACGMADALTNYGCAEASSPPQRIERWDAMLL